MGILAGILPAKPGIALGAGWALCGVMMFTVLVLAAHPIGARVGALLSGLALATPCFVWATPLSRCLLACAMFAPYLAAGALVRVPRIPGWRARLAYLLTWCGRERVQRRAPWLEAAALRDLLVATVVFAASAVAVNAAYAWNLGHPVRWLCAGIGILSFAEMATAGLSLIPAAFGVALPPLMLSPHRSASMAEFWSKRWNPFASRRVFRPLCFAPLARRSVAWACISAFAFSGVAHALLAYLGLGRWTISWVCGAFFFVQPFFIAAERWMGVRRWRLGARRAWTLSVLAVTSPLIIEPGLQMIERSWGIPDTPGAVLAPTVMVLSLVLVTCCVVSLACLAAVSAGGEPERT